MSLIPGKDFLFRDDLDGRGAYLWIWNSPLPRPTTKEAIDALLATPPPKSNLELRIEAIEKKLGMA